MIRSSDHVLADHIESVRLIDHHVHGFWLESGDRSRFESGLSEGNANPMADFGSAFDTQLGFALRAHCAPLLGLARHVDADTYWDHRSGYDDIELARVFLGAAGVSDWLVDTGLSSGVAEPALVSEVSGARAHEVLRLETLAQDAAHTSGDYAAVFEELLHTRGAAAIATKSILAYRGGFVGDLSDPSAASVREAAARWRDEGGTRLTDRVLLRFGLHQALRLGKPLQFHVGFGDRDCDLARANPLHLRDFLCAAGDTPVMLLHCYPFEREAGYLAQAFNNVYLDGGLSINFLGARARDFIGRLLELAPFHKILYSSDGYGPPELHYLGARLWRNGIRDVVTEFVQADEWSVGDAMRVVELIASTNARRVYGLG
ncbi:amidohydrolase family protein [Mycolicibacterium sp. YH-1]|uniref:amidohydrolase family protein n=1 Tax=Mycolicibacterium sp. YH-1 TaxID=2908837 RepID=UPI001F4BDFA1|nr:amidohydrolase family protein [Mycolicibacterium sp. YH-1]UNB55632.1 amidohydrolase family protein [Mycolicibacterium sp. YH-1]